MNDLRAATTSFRSRFFDALHLYGLYAGVSVRGQMQYKTSFLLLSAAQLITTGMEFLAVWALFARFGNLRGWTLPEAALFYGLINVSFAIADALSRGFDTFAALVKSGEFDRLLVRPRSTVLQVVGRDVLLTRVGRLLQGACVLGWAVHSLPVLWSAEKMVLAAAVILGGIALFCGLFIIQAALSFWTVETLELMNILTYGSTEAGQFPLSIYRPWFKAFFTFVVPLACVNIVPARVLLATGDLPPVDVLCAWLSPLAGFLFLVVALQFWRLGVRRYTSTGS
jgi:ABC-2 type transport system permease protein